MPRAKKKGELTMASEAPTLESMETELDLVRVELEKAKMELEERKKEMESLSSRSYSQDEIAISDKQIKVSSDRAAQKRSIEMMKIRDNEKVTGKFMNRRAPGQPAKLTYIKYEDDPVKWYYFMDGGVYTIPRGFADQINEYYHTPKFVKKDGEYQPSAVIGENSQIASVDTSNKKYPFLPVGF
jgi:hypothetical protein